VTPPARRAVLPALAVAAVLGSGIAGWAVAGPPADGAGTVPPPCPATLGPDPLAAGRGGVGDRLVPYPLPQPRGPVAVRLCAYPSASAGATPAREVALDPPRTARFAGVLDSPQAGVGTGTTRPADCPAGGPVTLLLFRYTQGAPLVASVDAACALVSTSARVERDREDVVRLVGEYLR
jgi:hypothetical protein